MMKLLGIAALACACGGKHDASPVAAAGSGSGSGSAGAAKPPAPVEVATTNPDGTLMTHPGLIAGKLPNGLSYYVLRNGKPEKRVELRLAVNAGSVLEDDDQRGLAHLVEHMAFNGTKKYEKSQIVDWLEKTGMKFGADVNARTTWDDTVYEIQVPTDDPALVAHGLDVLHEWASAVAFDPKEVDKERGVVLEERRLGRGAQGRLLDKIVPGALPDSKYGQRLPIGTEQVVKTATRDTLVRFYRDWYRPDLMAVIVIGDIDPQAMKKQIADTFGDLKAPEHAKPRPDVPVPPQKQPITLAVSDPELPFTVVAVARKLPHVTPRDEQHVRTLLADLLFAQILNERLEQLGKQDKAPFLMAKVGRAPVLRPIDVWFQGGAVKEGRITETLELISTELARVAKFGFVDTEIARAKTQLLQQLETKAKEADKTESSELIEPLIRTFLTGEVFTSREQDYALTKRLLPSIDAAQLKAVAAEVAGSTDRVVLAAGNTKTKLPEVSQLAAAMAAGEAKATSPWTDDVASGPLVATPPRPGTIASETKLADLGVTEWKLSNGIKVVLKPTDFQNDSLALLAMWPGGTSLASDADFVAADSAGQIMMAAGAGQRSASQLDKALAGTGAKTQLFSTDRENILLSTGEPAHFEELMQLSYLHLTAPREDAAAVAAWRDQQVKSREHQLDDPATVFDAKFREVSTNSDPRSRLLTSADFAKLDVARAFAFYRERIQHLGGMTVILVGAFKIDTIKPLILTYLGGIAAGPAEQSKPRDVGNPAGRVAFEVRQGIEPKASVRMVFRVATPWSRAAEHDLQALAEALSIRLREELREGMSGTYGVQVRPDFARVPKAKSTIEIRFGCGPANVDALIKAADAIIAKFQSDGPPSEVVDKIKATEHRERETGIKTNVFWENELLHSYQYGDDPRLTLSDDKLIDQLTVARLRDAAKLYLGKDVVVGVLRPK